MCSDTPPLRLNGIKDPPPLPFRQGEPLNPHVSACVTPRTGQDTHFGAFASLVASAPPPTAAYLRTPYNPATGSCWVGWSTGTETEGSGAAGHQTKRIYSPGRTVIRVYVIDTNWILGPWGDRVCAAITVLFHLVQKNRGHLSLVLLLVRSWRNYSALIAAD